MSKSEASRPDEEFLSTRSLNVKALMLIKALSKNDFMSIKKIIKSVETNDEKTAIFKSTYTVEKKSIEKTYNMNLIPDLAKKTDSDLILNIIKNFFEKKLNATSSDSIENEMKTVSINPNLKQFDSYSSNNCMPIEEVNQSLVGMEGFAAPTLILM